MPPSVEDGFQRALLGLLPRLRRFALSLTGNMAEADDLTQAACLRALERRRRYRDGTRLDSWLFRIAQNLWIDERRRHRRRREQSIDSAPLSHVSTPAWAETQAEDRLMLSAVDRAIMDLPEEQRAVLVLTTVDGLAYREAAAILGLPIGTVMSRLARARLALADALETASAKGARKVGETTR